ncbi:MAG: hypothetical protein CVT63_04635 [Candidatus Anoxymicrobium japonicum]|uniref:DUF86 domain-containing protein n=1 Tax=Candidatus Anoxymicrobium japonicum TaxID=2013648 RepID=A0A2N3G5U8_9ACTN|nr:MAG: hypothetical protein CVT63_04635 [Candidatus Anoxymicrobium japonicum]
MSRDEALFLDILLAARDAVSYLGDLDFPAFEKSGLHQDAVVRALEVIGEAAGRLSEEAKRANSRVPWHEITGMRNSLIHEYFRVDLEEVWFTVKNDIPRLVEEMEKLVPPEG